MQAVRKPFMNRLIQVFRVSGAMQKVYDRSDERFVSLFHNGDVPCIAFDPYFNKCFAHFMRIVSATLV